jgi:rhodanese-related sulfurtransferase
LVGRQFCCRRKKFDKTKPVFYIVKWKQKQKATEKLNELGFQNIQLDGGFMKWSDEGLNNAKE